MNQNIKMILGSHHHVAYGASDEDFKNAYDLKLKPFITTLYKFSHISVVLHSYELGRHNRLCVHGCWQSNHLVESVSLDGHLASCDGCHAQSRNMRLAHNLSEDGGRFNRHVIFNLTTPEKSMRSRYVAAIPCDSHAASSTPV